MSEAPGTRAALSRRAWLGVLGGALSLQSASAEPIVETHIHLFSADLNRFPGHPNGPRPTPAPLESYLDFARSVGIQHAIHVSAEPYQDDLRYLEYTLDKAPSGFLKGTVLYDPILPDTPRRLAEISRKYPGRILAIRIHCTRGRDAAPTVSGALRDRDLLHPQVGVLWGKAGELGVAIQAHIQPYFAPQVAKLAAAHPQTRVIVDHFGHAGVSGITRTQDGWALTNGELGYRSPEEFQPVLDLAKQKQIILKVSGLQYSSREPFPHRDVKPLARRAFDAFGPDRMVWGSFGNTREQFDRARTIFDQAFDFLSAADRAKIQGRTAMRLFSFAPA